MANQHCHSLMWVLPLVGLLLVKAHLHMVKLLLMGVVGLGGLYMMHNLATDFNKIQNTWNKGTGMYLNQHLSTVITGLSGVSNRGKRSAQEDWLMEKFPNDTAIMSNLLQYDSHGCARKYVCHISARPVKKQTEYQRKVLAILRTFRWLDTNGEWDKAEEVGRLLGRRGGCEVAYFQCNFTGSQLENFMSIFRGT
ncbi:uncharacterized protein [Halyomorpha halys]|uniref:uncharacterized protein n=1 Tax=Halyomorpha halys TaxID=286706 RepID=UPI0006D4F22C|nr:uncharacterized protein LOC106681404 [Halyomorpha halys]